MTALSSRVALITGAAGGIGEAVCRSFAQAGAVVAAVDLKMPLEGNWRRTCDMANDEGVATMCTALVQDLGAVDIVVHAAAICDPGGTLESNSDAYRRNFEINVLGAARLVRAMAPLMFERGGGSIILLSSINAGYGTPGLSAYATSKGALDSYLLTAALELAPAGVRVNGIAPASIDTPMLRASFDRSSDPEQARRDNIARHPLGRLGTADDVAALALFLASDASSWMTGQILCLDGGASLTRR